MVELVLLGSFVVFLFLGVPIAFSMGLSAMLTIVTEQSVTALFPTTGIMFASMASETLLAIPFFILAGVIMEMTGISTRLVAFADALFGHRKSGIALTTIIAAMVFASISGSGPATVAALGGILIPALVRHGYSKRHAASLMASAGEMGIIIPPSIAFIVFAVVASDYERVSITRLFAAGVVPGILLAVAFYLVARYLPRHTQAVAENAKHHLTTAADRLGVGPSAKQRAMSIDSRADDVPAGAHEAAIDLLDHPDESDVRVGVRTQRASGGEIWRAFVKALPGLIMPVIILGGIYGGIFTPTESAAVAVVYALVVGIFLSREIKFGDFFRIFSAAGAQSARIMFIIATASLFAYVITKYRIASTITDGILSITDNAIVIMLLVNVVLLIAGMFLDAVSAFYLFVPLIVPLLLEVGYDITTIGVFMTINLALGLVTPPVGLDLFVAAGIAKISFGEAVKGIWPFLGTGVAVLLLVAFVPAISNFLPDLMGL
ncbi:TRAP transporter large permease [Agrococcus sp. Marseille-P2731]|uniref:TRAP transporter large permease n=1 Tax=Agrococcus sp. Marseille-P2731 TaxID=1841862 RepID=UPI000932022D|nr:TRAP transporter large permease [Agrococcus sp. Marseille-P2731]